MIWNNAITNPPKDNDEYIIFMTDVIDGRVCESGDIGIGTYVDDRGWDLYGESISEGVIVLAWTEIPKPPAIEDILMNR